MTLALPRRRRLYLMRHGSVDYFLPDGTPVHPDTVPLNATGRAQADAAGAVFRQAGVRFDRVWVSGLPRTVETAERVLGTAGLQQPLEVNEALQEIRPGRLADLPRDRLREAFLGAFQGVVDESARFLGGESIGEMLDRILPAFQAVLADPAWNQALLVLHGAVNRGLLSYALAGQRCYLGRFEQAPACINIIDVGTDDLVVRAVNLAPTQWLHEHERHTTMEKLLFQYLRLDPRT
jgi:broad specificity phosphatase PhoE